MKTIVLVPVFNEWPHLLSVLRELKQYHGETLVIDDGSHDRGYLDHLNEDGVPFIRLPFNLGHWGAIQAGFRYALTKDYDGAVSFDGDGQHMPQEIAKLTPLLRDGWDLVVGGKQERGGVMKQAARKILKTVSGLGISDFTSGFRGYSRRAMNVLTSPLFSNFEYQDLGVLVTAKKYGLKMTEVPVLMRDRLGEKSKVFPGLYSVVRYFIITITFILVRKA